MSQENVDLAQAVSMAFANEGDIVALFHDEERVDRLFTAAHPLVHEDFETVVRGWPDGERTYASSNTDSMSSPPQVVDRTCRSSRSCCRKEDSNGSFRTTITAWRFTTRRASTASPTSTSSTQSTMRSQSKTLEENPIDGCSSDRIPQGTFSRW